MQFKFEIPTNKSFSQFFFKLISPLQRLEVLSLTKMNKQVICFPTNARTIPLLLLKRVSVSFKVIIIIRNNYNRKNNSLDNCKVLHVIKLKSVIHISRIFMNVSQVLFSYTCKAERDGYSENTQ